MSLLVSLGKGWSEVLGEGDGLLKKETSGGTPALQVQLAMLCFGVQQDWVQWSSCRDKSAVLTMD